MFRGVTGPPSGGSNLTIVKRMDHDGQTDRLHVYLRAPRAGLPRPAWLPHRADPAGLRNTPRGSRSPGISADYYLRLERERDRNPSPRVIEALARVLQLEEVETAYLLALRNPRQGSANRVASNAFRPTRINFSQRWTFRRLWRVSTTTSRRRTRWRPRCRPASRPARTD